MSQHHGGFYSLPNRSGSSTNLSFARSTNTPNGSMSKSIQQPFFTASTSSLPGALGIGPPSASSSSSTSTMSPSVGSMPGWTLSTSNHGGSSSSLNNSSSSALNTNNGINSNQWTRSGNQPTSQERFKSALESPSSRTSDDGGMLLYRMRSNSSGSLLADSGGFKVGTAPPTLSSSQGSDTSSSNENGRRPRTAGSTTSNGNNSTRNFLVPIGATGARQKLSILSASQRPKTAQSPQSVQSSTPTLPQHSPTSSEQSQFSKSGDRNRRRPQTDDEARRAQATSSPTFSRPTSAKKEGTKGDRRGVDKPRVGNRSRSTSVDVFSQAKANEGDASANNSPRWSSGTSTARPVTADTSTKPSTGSSAGTSMRPWRGDDQLFESGVTPTQEKPNPIMYRQTSHDSLQSAGQSLRSNPNGSPVLNRDNSNNSGVMTGSRGPRLGLGRRLVSREGTSEQATSPDLSVWDGEAHRSMESAKAKQTGRPSSSAGRERAAKLGAGFKSIFSSKATRDSAKEQSPKPSSSVHSSPSGGSLSHHSPPAPQQAPQFAQRLASQNGDDGRQQNRPRALVSPHPSFIDLNSAESAGWTASHERSNSATSSTSSQAKEQKGLRDQSSTSFLHADDERQSEEEEEKKPGFSSEAAPSLDVAFPPSDGLLDSFSSEDFFSHSNESKEGDGPMRQGKGPPTTGLNLHLASSSFPSYQYAVEQDQGRLGGGGAKRDAVVPDKSLPPTPDPNVPTETASMGEGRTPQQRNQSGSSTWSQNTILGPAAPIQPPPLKTHDAVHRIASTSSLSSSSRRGSAATINSDATGSVSDSHQSTARRLSSSAMSSDESGYSAPNSSRAWSPATFDKPNVPITSPLLAPVLSRQQQPLLSPERTTSPLQQRRVVSPLVPLGEGEGKSGGGSSSNSNSSLADAFQSIAPKTPVSTRSVDSGVPRPDLPSKSRERLAVLQPDPATLAKLENASGTAVPSPTPPLALFTEAGSDDTVRAAELGKATKATPKDPLTYVPPGALTYTRKGTAVRPTTANQSQSDAAPKVVSHDSDFSDTPRGSIDGRAKGGGSDEAGVSPVFNSRFSVASSEAAASAPSAFRPSTDDGSDGQLVSFSSNDFDGFEDETSVDAVNLLPSSAWAEVEAALTRFKAMSSQSSASDKGGLLRSVLLPFLALEAETPNVEVSGLGQFQSGKTRRGLFFEWIQHLLLELQTVQTSADRGAILESIACIIESRNFSASMFRLDEDDERKFYSVFGHILNYAIGELNKKGVYQNTLIFSGRLLAVAFFRVEGVASKLLRALPVNRFALERVALEAKWGMNLPRDWEGYKRRFPPSLHDFCFQDARSYLKMLDSQTTATGVDGREGEDDDRYLVRQPEVEVEMSGNWLRRWQSDDSELFFSFCRSYHRQLAGLLTNARTLEPIRRLYFGGPGYAHLATCIHQKCLSLVHRDILSVTTLSSQKNFNPGETANVLSGSTAGKPRHLEAANRRCTAIVVDIVRAPSSNNHLFGPMLGIHIKCLIKRTSLYDVQGVFCLLDWLDGVLSHMESAELPIERLVDIDFIIQTVWLLLKDADHALALMRTIAFCYSNFAILSSTSKHRIRFCQDILLHPMIFQKLFLSWSFTIRAYYLHLLVFRLARINDFSQPEDDVRGKTAISVARLFNQRLDEIRKRHDELSPTPSSADSGSEEEDDLARFKKRPQSFVSTIRHTPSIHKFESPGAMTKAERVLGIGMPDPVLSSKGESKGQSRAAKWLRALGGKGASTKGQKRPEGVAVDRSTSLVAGSPNLDVAAFTATGGSGGDELRKRMPKLDELDIGSDDEEGEDSLTDQSREDGGDETPTGNEAYEFNFEPRPGHENDQTAASGSSLSDLNAQSNGNEEEDKGMNEHISPNVSFDLQSPTLPYPPQSASLMDASSNLAANSQANGGNSGNPAQSTGKLSTPNAQGRISRAFSKRQSILPGPAFNLVNHESESEGEEEDGSGQSNMDPSGLFALQKKAQKQVEKPEPYGQSLHIYAVQSLREYEQTVQEHDDFFNSQPDASNPQVPRLPIQWPAMWSE